MAASRKTIQKQLLPGHVSDPHSRIPRPRSGNWLVPPEIYDPLNEKHGFDFDPCPNPRPEGFDGLEVEWGTMNWVNPPFWGGLSKWSTKAVMEQEKGRSSVVIAPVDLWIYRLVEAGAVVEAVKPRWHTWINSETGKRVKTPRPSLTFTLHGRQIA